MNGFYYQLPYPSYNDSKNKINIFFDKPFLSNLMYVIPEYGLFQNNNEKGNLYINLKINKNKKNNDYFFDKYISPKIIHPFEE